MFISQFNNLPLKNKIKDGCSHNLSVNRNVLKSNNDVFTHKYNNKVCFQAGWNSKIAKQIENCNVDEIAQQLTKLGIETDFKGDKTIAWCCGKVAEIFSELNHKYKLGLTLPKAIYVEDFSRLNIDKNLRGYCNWFPSTILKGSDKVFPERTLFLNSKSVWEYIDSIAEKNHNKDRYWSSNHFLTPVIHEFCHAAHQGYLHSKFNYFELEDKVKNITNEEFILEYQSKLGKIISKISNQASEDPLETIAEDMTRKISKSLDKELNLTYNPFHSSPYPNNNNHLAFFPLVQLIFKNARIERSVLEKAWNGEKC